MDSNQIRNDLCILISHYIRLRNPDIYQKLNSYCISNNILPKDCESLDQALDVNFGNFDSEQFISFIKTLTPDNDYPSLFRRLSDFPENVEPFSNGILKQITSKKVHNKSIYSIEIDKFSRYFVTGSDDNDVKIF